MKIKKKNFDFSAHLKIFLKFLNQKELTDISKKIINRISLQKKKKGSVFFFGNGGSHSTAAHASLDLNKNVGIRSMNFNDPSLLTAFANDYGFENSLKKILDFYCTKKDIVILISVSGNSKNLVNVVKYCQKKKIEVITFTGYSKKNKLISLNKNGLNFFVQHKGYNIVECIHSIYILSIIDALIGKSVYKIKNK